VSTTTTRHAEPDQACADAVDLARAAAEDNTGPGYVGAHVGTEVEADRVVTHLFACLSPAYVGWRWAVTVTRAARAKVVTVSESVLLPGPDSLLAPDWVPWTERVRPGDLKAGDLMPASSDDERLVPVVAIAGEPGLLDWDEDDAWRLGFEPGAGPVDEFGASETEAEVGQPAVQTESDQAEPGETHPGETHPGQPEPGEPEPDPQSKGQQSKGQPDTGQAAADGAAAGRPVSGPAARAETGTRARTRRRSGPSRAQAQSVGVLRPTRVLSAVGRDEAAIRWHGGDQGPTSPLASAAPAHCLTCGFMVRLSGPLGRVFGACANEFAPDDGKVVSVDHGCGAHSDGEVQVVVPAADAVAPKVDELGYDMLNTGATVPESVLETMDHELL
jgi:Protein of unknown function (DUF3027)